MTGLEFCVVLSWLLLPPLLLGWAALLAIQRRAPCITRSGQIQSWLLLPVLSGLFAFAFLVLAPRWLGRYLGIHDEPVMWAPFAFLAVAAALACSAWWATWRSAASTAD